MFSLDNVHAMNMASTLRQIPAAAVIHEWPRVADLVRSALARGDRSFGETDVAASCLTGLCVLWIVEHKDMVSAICVTQIVDAPQMRKCLLRYLAGSMEAIKPHIPAVEDYARRAGCKLMEGYARRGFVRRMPDWTERQVILQKEL